MKLAVVGAGGMGHAWTRTVQAQKGAAVTAIVDPLVASGNTAPWVDELEDVVMASSLADLNEAEVDAVIVTAFSPAHAQVIKESLELGLHVIVEKPFTTSLEDAEALVELAAKRNKYLMVSQNYRFFPGTQEVCRLVASGEYGPVRSVIGRFWCDWPGKPYQHEMVHPMALEMAIHHLDMVRAMFGAEATAGRVREWNPAWSPYRMGAALEALFEMTGDDTSFPFAYSGSLVGKAPRTPWGGLWRFEFEKASLIADEIEGTYGLFEASESGYELLSPFAGETMMIGASLQHFMECVEQGKEPWSSGRDNIGTMKMALCYTEGTNSTTSSGKGS